MFIYLQLKWQKDAVKGPAFQANNSAYWRRLSSSRTILTTQGASSWRTTSSWRKVSSNFGFRLVVQSKGEFLICPSAAIYANPRKSPTNNISLSTLRVPLYCNLMWNRYYLPFWFRFKYFVCWSTFTIIGMGLLHALFFQHVGWTISSKGEHRCKFSPIQFLNLKIDFHIA